MSKGHEQVEGEDMAQRGWKTRPRGWLHAMELAWVQKPFMVVLSALPALYEGNYSRMTSRGLFCLVQTDHCFCLQCEPDAAGMTLWSASSADLGLAHMQGLGCPPSVCLPSLDLSRVTPQLPILYHLFLLHQ